jgi:hypothetical protein
LQRRQVRLLRPRSLMTRGKFAEAHEQLHLAAEQDPLSVAAPFDEFFAYNFERDIAGEQKMLQQMVRVQPDFVGVRALNVVLSVEQHDCAAARTDAGWLGKTYTYPESNADDACVCGGMLGRSGRGTPADPADGGAGEPRRISWQSRMHCYTIRMMRSRS